MMVKWEPSQLAVDALIPFWRIKAATAKPNPSRNQKDKFN